MQQSGADTLPAIRVVLDTNAWVSDHGLRTATGAALIHSLQLLGGLLVLPEIVSLEMLPVLKRRVADARTSIEKSIGIVDATMGQRFDLTLPTETEVEDEILRWLDELSDLIEPQTMTESQLRTAVEGAINGRAPSHRKEQIRDDLIWQAAIEASRSCRTIFVSSDNDFWEGDQLHPDLQAEVAKADLPITAFRTVRECVQLLADQVKEAIDRPALASRIWGEIHDQIEQASAKRGFRLIDLRDSALEVYPTGQPDRLSVEFTLSIQLEDAYGPEVLDLFDLQERLLLVRANARAEVQGSSFVDGDGAVAQVLIDLITYQFDEGGQATQVRDIFARAGSTPDSPPLRHRRRLA